MAPILGYWTVRGRAQPIRYLLHYTGTEFEEHNYSITGTLPNFKSDWFEKKYALGLDFPNLPYYIDGDVNLTESRAILFYLGRKNNLVGSSEEDTIKLDISAGVITDVDRELTKLAYGDDYETAKIPFIADVGKKIKKLSPVIGTGPYILGEQLSVVDFFLFESMERYLTLVPDCLADYPKLAAFQKTFSELPAIKKYRKSPEFQKIQSRFYNVMAKFGAGEY